MNEDIEFLKKVFFLDDARIVKAEGRECGHKYLRVFTQTEEQKDLKIMTMIELRFTETGYRPTPRAVDSAKAHEKSGSSLIK